MAVQEKELTDEQIKYLAEKISTESMKTIAIGSLGLDKEIIKHIDRKYVPEFNAVAINKEILQSWRNRNSVTNQIQNLAKILYTAANDQGLIDPKVVRKVLDIEDVERKATGPEVTEEEFSEICNKLRFKTKHMMKKITVCPWQKEVKMDLNNLYCDLKLKLQTDKKTAPQFEGYVGIFENSDNSVDCYSEFRQKDAYKADTGKEGQQEFGKRILIKADPGIGKTTFCHKICFDWANEKFTSFTFVLYVKCKNVRPLDTIEQVIAKQMSTLMGLKVSEEKMRHIMKLFGSRCLLILDGLDEYDLKEINEKTVDRSSSHNEILKVIRGQKILNCNVLVTSRRHNVADVETYFDTIVNAEGFSRAEAKHFARQILIEEEKVQNVLNFNPTGHKAVDLHTCPILLSCLCFLVNEIGNKKVGEIYFRMYRCLYQKYIIRKHKKYLAEELNTLLGIFSKLAWKMLSRGPLFQKSDIFDEIGVDAFENGLLIGHDDSDKLIEDETADIYLSFPHKSLLVFLIALFSAQEHEDAKVGEGLIWLEYRALFHEFRKWFLCPEQTYFWVPYKISHDCSEAQTHGPMQDAVLNSDVATIALVKHDDNDKSYTGKDVQHVFQRLICPSK